MTAAVPVKFTVTIYGVAGPRYTNENIRFRRDYRTLGQAKAAATRRRGSGRFPATACEILKFVRVDSPIGTYWASRDAAITFWDDGEGRTR